MRPNWKCITEERFDNQQYVFPTQQADVLRLVHGAQKDNNVRRIIVFGSSVTAQCNPWSDIDVYFEEEEDIPHFSFKCLEASVDFWTNFTVDESLFAEIKENGVCVYSRDGNIPAPNEMEVGRTLLDMARSNYNAAKLLVGFTNSAGFCLQQSLALFLKHNLEINGIKYPQSENVWILGAGDYSISKELADESSSWSDLSESSVAPESLEKAFTVIGRLLFDGGYE